MMTTSPGWELSREFAHPRARALFREDFFWDAIDDHAPWGSDEGADALMFFGKAYDRSHAPADLVAFVKKYVGKDWSVHRPDDTLSEAEIEAYSASHLAVIAITLGMYLIHGFVPPDLKALGLDAIERELQPICLSQFGSPIERASKLNICRDRLCQAETLPPEHP